MVTIGGTANSTFAFQGTKYTSESSPPSGYFKIDEEGNTQGELIYTSGIQSREMQITAHIVSYGDVDISITDTYNSEGTAIETTTCTLGGVTTPFNNLPAYIKDNVPDIRELIAAAILEKSSGENSFTIEYDTEHCSYADQIIDIDITLNGTRVRVISITNGFSLYIDGTQYEEGDYYPAQA